MQTDKLKSQTNSLLRLFRQQRFITFKIEANLFNVKNIASLISRGRNPGLPSAMGGIPYPPNPLDMPLISLLEICCTQKFRRLQTNRVAYKVRSLRTLDDP